MYKKSYFQGTVDPKKKPKYKPISRDLDQPRGIFFKNYDLYDNDSGPGSGLYQYLKDYKSVKEFLEKSRKKVKDAFYFKKTKSRIDLLNKIIKNAIDFPIDEQINSPILSEEGTYSSSIPLGGILDEYLPNNDFEGKDPTQLNFSRDYTDIDEDKITNILLDKFFSEFEPSLIGLPNQVYPVSELDSDSTISNRDSAYGIYESGNDTYKDKSY